MPESVRQLLPRLRDPGFTRVLLVTLPEATPVHEARALVLAARRMAEQIYLDEVASIAHTVAVVPWVPEPPCGAQALVALATARAVDASGG